MNDPQTPDIEFEKLRVSTKKIFEGIPADVAATVITRHSQRHEISGDDFGDSILLTEHGRKLARNYGRLIRSGINVKAFFSSPVMRCIETAEAIRAGMMDSKSLPVHILDQLGHPGYFSYSQELITPEMTKLGSIPIINRLLAGTEVVGMNPIRQGAGQFIAHIVNNSQKPGVNIYISHGNIIAMLICVLLNLPSISRSDVPEMLESIALWRKQQKLHILWRGNDYQYSLNNDTVSSNI